MASPPPCPPPDDAEAYEIYSQLLGEVDYEVPTPAVVKEGHLAPYRDFVWFTEPAPTELIFIRKHALRLHALVRELLSTHEGVDFLTAQLQPPRLEPAEIKPAKEPVTGKNSAREAALAGIDQALAQDFFLTRSCGVVLREVVPEHPLVQLLPPALLERCTTDDLLSVLSRYALVVLPTDPAQQSQWASTKVALADFGYHLTDRGILRGRNPIELTLATSESKDHAAVAILRHELGGVDAERIRAVVITDFAVHGSQRVASAGNPAGALRCFDTLCSDPHVAQLRPVLMTGQRLRVRSADAPLLASALAELLEFEVTIEAVTTRTNTGITEVTATSEHKTLGAGSGRIVAAVSKLVAPGMVRLIVGTRGLLGEGWDCPPVNTLIDLTAVATSSATQQLRGRSLRLDPQWPGKVAHNWSVACLIPADILIDTPG